MKLLRIAVAVIGFLSAIFLPWWIPVICIIILALRWRAWEAIFLGVFMDLLWLSPGVGLPLFTIFAIAIVWVFEPLRNEFLA
jgi:hypothetical protein